MTLPKLEESQTTQIAAWVAEYIDAQRQGFSPGASNLDTKQKAVMQPFFPASVLDSTKLVVLSGQHVSNPPFYPKLKEMGFDLAAVPDFSQMGAITFVDTVVSHEPFSDGLLFHELVHVVQYEKLGLNHFADKYVRGFLTGGSYEAIPLEKNAYQLGARFEAKPTEAFSAEDEVEEWIDFGLF